MLVVVLHVATVVAPDAKPSVLLVLVSAIYGTNQHQKHKQARVLGVGLAVKHKFEREFGLVFF